MSTISFAFHISFILIITDDFQAGVLASLSLIGTLNSHLLNILIFLYSHTIFPFFPNVKTSSEFGIIFTFN